MTAVGRRARSLARLAGSLVRGPFSEEHPAPVFLLGHQKSGTTAIAALLAESTGQSVTLDLLREAVWPSYPALDEGSMSFERFVRRNRHDFSREIVKEPQLTLFYEELREHFPRARFVYVVRDARDNLRSLLDRIGLRGDGIRDVSTLPIRNSRAWRLALDGRSLGVETDDPLEVLAHRWNRFADVYLEHRDEMELVRYEEFREDPARAVEDLARALELEPAARLGDPDRSFQPRGRHRSVDLVEFFGAHNLVAIEEICGKRMAEFGYRLRLVEEA